MRALSTQLAAALVLAASPAAAADVQITVTDPAPYHAHSPGSTFTVDVMITYGGSATITCQWHDFAGQPLGQPTVLTPSATHTITSPSTKVGYYELVFKADDPAVSLADRNPGQTREYGFVVLPALSTANRKLDPTSPFGMVHADMDDPYLVGWIKTMTWASTGTTWWKYEMDQRRNVGLIELPMAVGTGWDSDDTVAISAADLGALKTKITGFFQADPQVLFWELGIEENLKSTYNDPFYWPNLAAKVNAVRQAADAVNPNIKLIYQVVSTKYTVGGSIDKFLSSSAAQTFDILSLHPYKWPDFPAPETWLAQLIDDTTAQMQAKGVTMPIWFTEVGAPHHGNPGGFFGYPSSGNQVTGLTREREATYMMKLHVIALHKGVERLFWYNYVDKGSQLEYAEDHFGMVDYWKFPKAVYAAYHAMHSRLGGKTSSTHKQLAGGVEVYTFTGAAEDCIVAWVYPPADQTVALTALRPGLTPAQVTDAVNTVGTPISVAGGNVALSKNPVLLVASNTVLPPDAGPADSATPADSAAPADGGPPDAPPSELGPPVDAEAGIADLPRHEATAVTDSSSPDAPPGGGGSPTLESGCGCAVPGARDDGRAALALLALALLVAVRRQPR